MSTGCQCASRYTKTRPRNPPVTQVTVQGSKLAWPARFRRSWMEYGRAGHDLNARGASVGARWCVSCVSCRVVCAGGRLLCPRGRCCRAERRESRMQCSTARYSTGRGCTSTSRLRAIGQGVAVVGVVVGAELAHRPRCPTAARPRPA